MSFLANLVDYFRLERQRHLQRPLLRAAMAASALAASADGEVSFGERVRVDQVLETLEALRIFNPHEGVDLFNTYADGILADPQAGRETALEAVTAGAIDQETAELMIRICLAVVAGNSEVPKAERIEVVRLCNELGVDPTAVGLDLAAYQRDMSGDDEAG